MSIGAKEDKSKTVHVWGAGFHHVMVCSRLAHILKLMNRLFFNFHIFFSGRSKPWITETADTGQACIMIYDFI
jgi:hypothetical protein